MRYNHTKKAKYFQGHLYHSSKYYLQNVYTERKIKKERKYERCRFDSKSFCTGCVKGSRVCLSMMWVILLHYVRGQSYKKQFWLNPRRSAGQHAREDVRLSHIWYTHMHTCAHLKLWNELLFLIHAENRCWCALLKAKRGRRERYAPWNVQVSTC